MKVLITGIGGFLGQILSDILKENYAVHGLGRKQTDYNLDLSKEIPKNLGDFEIVVHAAGKAHSLPKTKAEEQSFFDVNVEGTKNLLRGLERLKSLPRTFVFISSVAVYGIESGVEIEENYPLMAKDPYGLSKIQAEAEVKEWCKNNSVICSILRLPLLVGANPPGNLGKMIKGIEKGYYFNIAGGSARKSMVIAEDVARAIPKIAEVGGVYHLTDGYHPSFYELSEHIAKQLGKKRSLNIGYWPAKLMSILGDMITVFPFNSIKLKKMTTDLTFNDTRAREILGWKSRRVLDSFQLGKSGV